MSDFHSVSIKTVFDKLKTKEEGLTWREAEKRLEKHGFNALPEEKPLSSLRILISQFHNALVYILLAAGVLSFFLGEVVDASVIFAAVILNVLIGFLQENKANQAIQKLKRLVEHKAFVSRDGREISLASKYIALGDIIWIKAGNRVPADARLIDTLDLRINEASLTGESVPSEKNIKEISKGAALADRLNMIYAGTVVSQGSGRAVVTAIGRETEIGKIAEMVNDTKEESTPLQKRLESFSRLLGLVCSLICVLVVAIGLAEGRPWLQMVETGVAVGVASIPEGLTVSVTFILALGMRQILRRKALVRKLVAAETLGSITVICTDKTGTLTEGKMQVTNIVIGEREFEVKSQGTRQDEEEARAVSMALQAAMMCNDAVIENPDDALSAWKIIGTPTEVALLSAAVQSGLRQEKLLQIEPKISELSFDSEKKYMISLHRSESGGSVMYEKGAPERVLEKCTKYHHQGKICALTEDGKRRLYKNYENLTGRGLRVIGLAVRRFNKVFDKDDLDWGELDQDLTFIGFIAIKDPLRPEAKETIALCMKAGIRPIIITGDHKLTAKAIAHEIGLKSSGMSIVTGEELDKIGDDDFRKMVKKIDIYARVSPHHKLRIVKALQSRGEVVAMTGDGINDSPALKAADIGISLGTGTDIAKETSDIVLLDDNFRTIVSTIKQGRIIFANIRKVITYLVSDGFSEVSLVVGSIFFNTPLAVIPVQILWINIVNDSLPHFSLAFEKEDDDVMSWKPIRKDEQLINKQMKVIIFGVGIARDILLFGIFWYLWKFSGASEVYLRTIMFAVLGVKSLFSIFSLRSFTRSIFSINPFSNKYLNSAVFVSLSLLLLGIYWPPLQYVLGTVDLLPAAWVLILAFSFFNIILLEMVKYIFTRQANKFS